MFENAEREGKEKVEILLRSIPFYESILRLSYGERIDSRSVIEMKP